MCVRVRVCVCMCVCVHVRVCVCASYVPYFSIVQSYYDRSMLLTVPIPYLYRIHTYPYLKYRSYYKRNNIHYLWFSITNVWPINVRVSIATYYVYTYTVMDSNFIFLFLQEG